jgi:peptidoglycan/xylan/chitin deacetylase (PgdA/CDA1 family)
MSSRDAVHPWVATIVMYHVVHSDASGASRRLKGLDVAAFRGQLAYIQQHYTPVPLSDLAAAAAGVCELPPRPIVLSFDDGYAAHFRVVFPLLAEAGVPAAFFPAASALIDRRVLNVNKLQYILAASDVSRLVERIEAAIDAERPALPRPDEYRRQWWKASRWDPPEVVYVKRLLQDALPESVRRPLVDELFRSLVSGDERAFADELYMTVADACAMLAGGMNIGAHGDRHVRLPTLSRDEQAVEIDGALRVLDAVGSPRQNFVYCYANGAYNEDSLELLRARGCRLAVTTRPDLARLDTVDLLVLPRIDTNDLPVRPDAEPNEWTRRAAAAEMP